MEARNGRIAHTPTNQEKMRDFLAQFDEDKNKCLFDMALCVDRKVDAYLTYASDGAVYGRSDYWATPVESVLNKRGDCEDFAILKYGVLCHLGVPESRLRIMTVGKTPSGLNHAILVVDTRSDADCAKRPLDRALVTRSGLAGIYILENDNEGKMEILDKSGYYAFGIMNKTTGLTLGGNPFEVRRPF